MKIILDTNFLIDALRFKFNLKSELAGNELFVLDSTIDEVKKLSSRNTKEFVLARMTLDFIKNSDVKVLKSIEKETDDSLVSYSKDGYAIATHDRALKVRLKKASSKIVFIRQKKLLEIE